MAKRKSSPSLRDFRHKISQLKAKGLVSNRVDARSQKPTRYFKAKVKRLEPALSGENVAVKVKREFLADFRRAGYAVDNGRVVVHREPGEILKARRGLPEFERVIAAPLGGGPRIVQRRLILPASVHNIHDLLDDMRRRPDRWNSLKRPDDRFAFKLMNGRSRATFEDIESVADYLEMYEEKFDGDDSDDLWEGLEFLSIGPDDDWYSRDHREELARGRRARRSQYAQERRERGASWKSDQMRRADKAQSMRDARAKLTEAQRAQVREADRVRKAIARNDLGNVRREYDLNNARRKAFRRFGKE